MEFWTREAICNLNDDERRRLIEDVFRELPPEVDPEIAQGQEGSCRVKVVDLDELSFSVSIESGRLRYEAVTGNGENFSASANVTSRSFLVAALVHDHDPFPLPPGEEMTATGDENLVTVLLAHFAVLPSSLRKSLAVLDARPKGAESVIERHGEAEPALIERAIRAKIPLVIRDANVDWPAKRWTLDSFANDFGHVPYLSSTLGERVAEIRDSGKIVQGFSERLPDELKAQFGPTKGFPSSFQNVETFLSGPQAITPLHRDLIDGLAIVSFGPREFWLFPPSDAEALYAQPLKRVGDFQKCSVSDPRNVDSTRFPRFVDARPTRITVMPGDMIFVPAGWFHAVVTVAPSLITKFVYSMRDTWKAFAL